MAQRRPRQELMPLISLLMSLPFHRLLPWPFYIAGSIFVIFGVTDLRNARESLEWPSVPGIVTESSVVRVNPISESRGGSSGPTYHARVHYQYTVEDKLFVGSRIAYGDHGKSDRGHAAKTVEKYPELSDIDVFYMPNNPEESLLEPGRRGQSWFKLQFAGGLFCFGVVLVLFAVPRNRKELDAKMQKFLLSGD